MRGRKHVRRGHELSVIEQFVTWYNQETSSNFTVFSLPDPPDAILNDNDRTFWVEHADIYRSREEAREEYSAATPGEEPYFHEEFPIHDPDKRIALVCADILRDKLGKTTYKDPHDKYGPGVLILTERDSLFDDSTLTSIREEIRGRQFEDPGYFGAVFLGIRSLGCLCFTRIYPA